MKKLLNAPAVIFAAIMIAAISAGSFAQSNGNSAATALPVVTKIDDATIKPLLRPNGKPLLINFWATWCVPCTEEFPLLVELDNEYKGRIDFITISLDDLAEIKRDVPKFLSSQKAYMPAYLLHTRDENAVIGAISKNWTGGLPFSILYSPEGSALYEKQGLLKAEIIKPLIDGAIPVKECKPEEDH